MQGRDHKEGSVACTARLLYEFFYICAANRIGYQVDNDNNIIMLSAEGTEWMLFNKPLEQVKMGTQDAIDIVRDWSDDLRKGK
jgi:hypothetical protein